ncbi:winged helix-turn-helix domain-containing protein [Ensifer adhaerens]|uniref:winged helix-turn-helix domain-containing protein n=1 Tax=Ensifer adhaerens TaxID=106592 RepID=UPI0023A9CCC1|nr:winged helix-turn-helix domain-containing protein [Ensifer adhaerens]WDZ77926.1 winged helix-turn-helix domain-containing protein [Ensifer adhaerens]
MSACPCPTCGQVLPPQTFAIDWEAGIVIAAGRFAQLTRSELAIFETLYQAKGQVKSKEHLLNAIASHVDDAPEIKIVDVFVCKIRKKIAGLGVSIETIWGGGYRLLPRKQEQAA